MIEHAPVLDLAIPETHPNPGDASNPWDPTAFGDTLESIVAGMTSEPDHRMAKFIEATETEHDGERRAIMAEILRYNEEDLRATWAVLHWLRD